jgi:hypothetical protein
MKIKKIKRAKQNKKLFQQKYNQNKIFLNNLINLKFKPKDKK